VAVTPVGCANGCSTATREFGCAAMAGPQASLGYSRLA
jgi:hypothetical protein